MKKASLTAIYSALKDTDFDADILAELDKEIHKGEEQKAKNAQAYEDIHDIVIGALSDAPATCSEIFEAIESELPMGMTKSKVQYALTHLWQDEIVKVEGKPNGYRKA